MKVETVFEKDGATKLVPYSSKLKPVKLEVFTEQFASTNRVRQYVAVFQVGDDKVQVTGENVQELLWRLARVILGLVGDNVE